MNNIINLSETYPKGRLTRALVMEADGTRPLKCKYCRSTFRYKKSLEVHIKEVHIHPLEWSERQTLPAGQHNQMINTTDTNRLTNIDPERVAISQFNPVRRDFVIIQNPNVFY